MPRGLGWIYQALVALGLVLAGPVLLFRRGRHYLPTLSGRLGGDPGEGGADGARRPGLRPLWIHAVSVGEAAVAATLAPKLPDDPPLLVTTITPTGQARARSGMKPLADRARVAYLPFDLGLPIARFLGRHDPCGLLLVEGDYWPLLLAAVKRRGLPVGVANGRLSDRSFPRLLRFRGIVRRWLLDAVDRFAVQTEGDRERLLALGVASDRVAVTGNLKFDMPAPPPNPDLAARLARLAEGRPIVVAGSTMPGEEEAVLAAHAVVAATTPALLVLAPRHPERFAAVAALARERVATVVRRSGENRPRPDVFLLDSIGELAASYREAAAAFVGGTLVPTGGHNPIEAARFGVPVAVGPSMENFREIAETFDREGAWQRVANAAELGAAWAGWLADPETARAIGGRGRRLVDSNRGATERTVAFLAPVLERAAALRSGGDAATPAGAGA